MSETSKDLADLRREYSIKPLHRSDLDPDPIKQFANWFDEALHAEAMDPNAMSIANEATRAQAAEQANAAAAATAQGTADTNTTSITDETSRAQSAEQANAALIAAL